MQGAKGHIHSYLAVGESPECVSEKLWMEGGPQESARGPGSNPMWTRFTDEVTDVTLQGAREGSSPGPQYVAQAGLEHTM